MRCLYGEMGMQVQQLLQQELALWQLMSAVKPELENHLAKFAPC